MTHSFANSNETFLLFHAGDKKNLLSFFPNSRPLRIIFSTVLQMLLFFSENLQNSVMSNSMNNNQGFFP